VARELNYLKKKNQNCSNNKEEEAEERELRKGA
jgi:hypothetical protein